MGENTFDQVTNGFDITSEWLRKWRDILTNHRRENEKQKNQIQITFDTQLKTTLTVTMRVFIDRLKSQVLTQLQA